MDSDIITIVSIIAAVISVIVGFIIALIVLIGKWKIYTKAGRPGWACIVPFYNLIVLLDIIGKPIWWIALYFVPLANVVVAFLVYIELAKAFGKGVGYGLGLRLLEPLFIPLLGFGSARYQR